MIDCEICEDFLSQSVDWREACPECGRLWLTCFNCGHNFLAYDESDTCLACGMEEE